MIKTYLPYEPDQQLLLPAALQEWLPDDHLAYFISDVVDQLDMSKVTARYERERRGGPPYHPRMMVKVLLYGYCVGVASSRRIAQRLHEDIALCWRRTTHRTGASIVDTAEGREIAFRYLTGEKAGTIHETSTEGADWIGSPPPVSDILVSDAELVIPPPLQPAKLLELHRWLTEVAKAQIGETIGTRGEDFVMEVAVPQPIPLLRMLAELPDVARVTQEPYRREGGTAPWSVGGQLGVRHTMLTQIRVMLKPE